jgi:hypothetical protein
MGHIFTCINFTNQKIDQRSVLLNGVRIPPANTTKYLSLTLDAKLRWTAQIKKKQGELEIKFRKMYWLLGRRSELSMYNKLFLYKQVLRSVWTYGVQLWGCARKCNIDIIQRYQNKVLRCLVRLGMHVTATHPSRPRCRNSRIHHCETRYLTRKSSLVSRQ